MMLLKAFTILVIVAVPGGMGAAVDFRNRSDPKTLVILDTNRDSISSYWKIIEPWFEYVESPEILEGIVKKNPAYGSVTFSDWADLAPVSKGIWALMHQDSPPEFNLEEPYFSYKQFNGVFRNLNITLYMHGLCNVTILTGSTLLEVIPNRCGENCGKDFRTISINLDADKGVNEFNVSLSTSPGAFILIDIIEASDTEDITPTTTKITARPTGTDTTMSPSDSTIPASLETSSVTSIETSQDTDCAEVFQGPEINDARTSAIILELDDISETTGWAIEAAWFVPVDSTDQIQEVIDNNPWYSGITFEEWEDLRPDPLGLWCLFHQDLTPEFGIGPPSIGYKNGNVILNYHNIFITYFMFGSCSIHIFAEDVLVRSISNPCGTSCSLDFVTVKVALNSEPYQPGKTSFHIVFNTTQPEDFLIIDKIQADDVQRTSPACTTTAPTSPTISIGSSTEGSPDQPGTPSEYPSSITSDRPVASSDSSPDPDSTAQSMETSTSDLTTDYSDPDPTSVTSPSTSRSSSETAPSESSTSEASESDPTSEASTGPDDIPGTTPVPATPVTTESQSSSLFPDLLLTLLFPVIVQGLILFSKSY